jgi:DNA-binding response OmpR family regulator
MKKVLVIEDSRDILDNISELLQLSNYKVFTAENGKIGIETALATKPDIIICDIMMPELDGYGVLHIVHNHPELQHIPFIFLTARTEQSEVRKGMSLGADDYITKPFDTTDLLNAIESRLKKAEVSRLRYIERDSWPTEIFSSLLGEKNIASFLEGRSADFYKKRRLVYSEGNHPIRLYFLKKGKIKIFKTNHDGKELIIKIIKDGDFFGYTAIFENAVYTEGVETIEDSEIIAIPVSEFHELLNRYPDVAKRFLHQLAIDLTHVREQMLHIAYNSLRSKVADALLTVHNKYKEHPGLFSINMSRENLAALAGTATESLIRTLSDFKNEKLIDIKEGKIAITDMGKLQNLIQ